MEIQRAMTIDKPAAALYRYWHNLENLPRFMAHLQSVQPGEAGRSRWVVELPLGRTLEWEAELTEAVEGERLAWRSLPESPVEATGRVHFRAAPGDRGTEVHLVLRYEPPGGVVGEAIAGLFEEGVAEQLQNELRRFKMLMETGEIATLKGQPSGRGRDN